MLSLELFQPIKSEHHFEMTFEKIWTNLDLNRQMQKYRTDLEPLRCRERCLPVKNLNHIPGIMEELASETN